MLVVSKETETKRENLRQLLRDLKTVAIAYSGGADSAYLLYEASLVLGKNSIGVIADSPSLPRAELQEALELAQKFGWQTRVVATQELENAQYAANPVNRCYFCKQELFVRIETLVQELGIKNIAYGENADDAFDFRPGQKAAKEFCVVAPLRDAGLTKKEIRELSAQAGLPTAQKVAMPCLASRLPTGETVTFQKLKQIETGEQFLREEGFSIYRLRHLGQRARIQVGANELEKLKNEPLQRKLAQRLRNLGFNEVEFDWQGYQGPSSR